MSQDGDDPAGKPPARPPLPSTMAGLPPPRPGLPLPRPGSSTQSPPFRPASQPAIQPPSQPAPPPAQPASRPPQHEAPPYTVPEPSPYAAPAAPFAPAAPYAPPAPQAPSPYAAAAAPSPYAAPPAPYAPSPFEAAPYPSSQPGYPQQPYPETESSPIQQLAGAIEKVPGKFVGFLKISTRRAFRLRIEPTEVLPDERAALMAANPPVLDENLQAFLAWRRSVLFLVATLLVPLSIIGIIDSFSGVKVAPAVRYVKLFPALAETLFCAICWLQLRRWAHWRTQRRWLFIGWLIFMLTPFIVFIYPLKSAFEGMGRTLSVAQIQELGWTGMYNKAVAPFAFAMIAMFQLAPKVISLMPGLIRSSLVIKLLFPGSAAPGWLIVFSAPLYAMIAYALLIIPYQFTGQPWFVIGIILIVIAQVLVAKSGFHLARPLTQDQAMVHIKTVRKFYLTLLLLSAACIIGGLGVLANILSMKWTTIVSTILKFESNVLILTMIGADLVVTNLDRARAYTHGKEKVEEETEQKIAAFVGLNAQPGQPPT